MDLPSDVFYNTSIYSICAIDAKKACTGDPSACENGFIKDNLCDGATYSAMPWCQSSDTRSTCAKDWRNCLASSYTFHFCFDFPELCKDDIYAPAIQEFTTWQEVNDAICAFNGDRFCPQTGTANLLSVCEFGYELPYEIVGGTGIEDFCFYIDHEYFCKELGLCNDSGDVVNNLCDTSKVKGGVDLCANYDSTKIACASDVRSCLFNPEFNFCE